MLGLFTFAILVQRAVAHSWVECSAYDPVSFDHETLGGFERSRCSGYPRGFQRQFDAGFGVDTGYNWGHPDCARDPFKESDYNDQIKMAKLVAGQTFYVSHPSKNHVADTCTNPFIPSTELKLMMSSGVGGDTFDVSLQLVGGEHVNGVIDHLGYQRCFDFCGNKDKAHCVTGWKLPENIQEGRHSFIWIWQFNPFEYYSNCFDAYISASGNAPVVPSAPSATPATTTPRTTPAGFSNSSSGSSSNDTITLAPITFPTFPTSTPTPTPTPAPTPANTTPAPNSTSDSTANAPIDSSTSTPSSTSQVVTSGTNNIASPLVRIGSYILNFTGSFNISGFLKLDQ